MTLTRGSFSGSSAGVDNSAIDASDAAEQDVQSDSHAKITGAMVASGVTVDNGPAQWLPTRVIR